jgi:hypothetical protein
MPAEPDARPGGIAQQVRGFSAALPIHAERARRVARRAGARACVAGRASPAVGRGGADAVRMQ